MGGTGVVDRFLAIFSQYIDSGFGLLSGEVAFIATTLIVIDVTLAALFWSWGANEDIIARLVKKTLFVGIFAYIIGNWSALTTIIFNSFAGLGLKASGSGLGAADLLRPGRVAQVGIDAAWPMLEAIADLVGYVGFFENFLQIVILLIAWAVVVIAFFILSIQLFVTLIEFKLTTLAGFVLIPFGLFGKTAFLAERVLGNVVSSGIKVLVLAVIIGIGSTLFAEFQNAIPGEPTIEDALAIVLASLTLLGLGIFGPGIANGIVAGGPQLGAGAAAGTALLAGGVAAGGLASARLAGGAVASAASSVAGGATRAAGGATMAYAIGSAGKSGGAAVASGMAGVGQAAAGVATSPLRTAADSARSSFRDGARSAVGHMGGHITPAPGAAHDEQPAGGAMPGWARTMKQRQSLGQAVSLAVHTVRSGDGHGAGASIDTREKD
ncbi:P-type conjugative transfer protein TrbL [Porphyrobacter sp. ULC335]|uniref:P-type conjugative transfer protein TrbL n=1 Tax=Porphyrobacter sp. ULC335 TaxID=2854260 RepID=UPI00221E6755|nr:P-type conjugative transfer protein TrbL [Porphyrobacter sp. ULC335]UYV16618.1 P-type conjugative transfer protein TrbL [Porphyrobacter sp. ULC335]